MEPQYHLPIGVRILAGVLFLFGLFAFIGSLFMWGKGFLLSFPPGVDYRFPSLTSWSMPRPVSSLQLAVARPEDWLHCGAVCCRFLHLRLG